MSLTSDQLLTIRRALRLRLQSDDYDLSYQENECISSLISLFGRTIEKGENQSGLLIGMTGGGQHVILRRTLQSLHDQYGSFTCVYLNGKMIENEIEAFKELVAQLTHDPHLKHPSLTYSTMYRYLKSLLQQHKTPIFILIDAIEKFSYSKKPFFLYNLFDWMQEKNMRIGILGMTNNYTVMDQLEKRIRSRFSKIQIIIPLSTFESIQTMLKQVLTLKDLVLSQDYIQAFNTRILSLFTSDPLYHSFQQHLQQLWEKGRSREFFIRLTHLAISYLSLDRSLLSPAHFHKALQLLEPDYQVSTLRIVNTHGLGLLISMSHLEQEGHCFFTLEMVYRKWQEFYRKYNQLNQVPTRSETQLEIENLIDLRLVEDAGDAYRISNLKFAPSTSLQPQYRVIHLCFEPKTLETMIRHGTIECTVALKEWMMNKGI